MSWVDLVHVDRGTGRGMVVAAGTAYHVTGVDAGIEDSLIAVDAWRSSLVHTVVEQMTYYCPNIL
jgi:hypothetical protein